MPQPWSDDAIRHLLDATTCPRCDVDALHDRRCLNCGADLRGEIADQLWAASTAAVAALRSRQQILDLVPVEPVTAGASVTVAPSAGAATTTVPDAAAAASAGRPAAERSSATVQSVLAVAGAGLFAIAAIVFTFLNPDLHDHVLRSVIVGIVTLVFLGGAWLLARRGLQFSAEAIGALGMVFVALDVYAVSELAPDGVSGWVFTAIGTLASTLIMIAVGALARIRSWLFVALAGLAFVPAMLGYAGYDAGLGLWPTVLGHLGVAFGVLGLLEGVRKLAPRFGAALTADRVMLTALQAAAVATVVIQLPFAESPTTSGYWLSVAATLAGLTILAALATRHLLAPMWSFLAGGFAVAAIAVLPFALDLPQPQWYLAMVPAAAAVAVVALALLPTLPTVSRGALTGGVVTVAAAATVTTVFFGAGLVLYTMASVVQAANYGPEDLLGPEAGISIVLGLVAAAAGLAVYAAVGSRRSSEPGVGFRIAGAAAVSLLMLGALTFASWSAWLPVPRIAIAIGVALATALLLIFVRPVRESPLALRVPAIVGAHLALVLAGLLSWGGETWITAPAGVAIVAVLVAVAHTIRTADHPFHVGVGYAYSLVLVARALDLTDQLSTVAVFSLTTSVGAVAAVAATLVRRLRAPAWYAVLIVTAVPFLIGVGIALTDRSGWAALSSGLIFVLALTLMLTRRPGLKVGLRAVSAGLLVPTLAVVVTNLAAELPDSGSPVALPVIAVIVAGVLPSTALIRAALIRHGLPEREASLARIWIEGSALLTGVIAVVLALVRQAAGLDTSFIVLVVLGLGAAAAAIWGKRRYGWWVAFASFTGALWCVWALQGITLIEPYLLPPALALAIIGVIVTARGGQAAPLFATGLAVATVPVLCILAIAGNGDGAVVPWRAVGLLAGAWALLLIGAVIGRGPRDWMKRLGALRLATLAASIVAGSAGAIQAIRYGIGRDDLPVTQYGLLMTCLAFGIAGAIAAAAAARIALDSADPGSRIARTRWLYAPAVAYVATASWWAIHPSAQTNDPDDATNWTMWGLMVAVLAFMVVIVLRARRRATTLPPVWFVFALAFVTSIVAWSPRHLHVEWYSVTLGLFLLACGLLTMRGVSGEVRDGAATGNSWPIGHHGSWRLLGPGIAVMLSASMVATFTYPATWRAIAVIAAALIAILIGSQFKLAAPFFLGIVALPIENIVVFAVQIGRKIESVPWWITLAVVGAVLLIIAVTYERRSGADGSIAARLRDLK